MSKKFDRLFWNQHLPNLKGASVQVGVPKGTIMSRLFHARNQLAERMRGLGHELTYRLQKTTTRQEEGTESMREPNIDDLNIQLIYRQLWNRAVLDVGAETRSLRNQNPKDLIHKLAQDAGVKISKSSARFVLGKLTNVKLDWKQRPCRITCTIDPAKLSTDKNKAAKPAAPSAPSNRALQKLNVRKSYRFLYNKKRGKGGSYAVERWTTDPELKLRNKWGENKDVEAAVLEMVNNRWAEWKNVTLPGESTPVKRFILKVDPNTLRTNESMTHAKPAPPPPQTRTRRPEARRTGAGAARRPHPRTGGGTARGASS